MAPLKALALLATVAHGRPTLDEYKEGKATDAADSEAERKNQAKMAAVNKVIKMLEDLQTQVLGEGEKEAASYNQFACFCKDSTKEKSDAITKGTDDKESLTTTITDLSEKRDDLDEDIAALEEDIETTQSELDKAKRELKETWVFSIRTQQISKVHWMHLTVPSRCLKPPRTQHLHRSLQSPRQSNQLR